MTFSDIGMAIAELKSTKTEVNNLTDHTTLNNNRRNKRSLLPCGHLFSFLHGTADQNDLNGI